MRLDVDIEYGVVTAEAVRDDVLFGFDLDDTTKLFCSFGGGDVFGDQVVIIRRPLADAVAEVITIAAMAGDEQLRRLRNELESCLAAVSQALD